MKSSVRNISGALLVAMAFMAEAMAGEVRAGLDPDFRIGTGLEGGDDTVGYVVHPLPNGQLLVGGDFTSFNGVARPNLVRLNADGLVDESFHLRGGLGAEDEPAISNIGIQPDGMIVVSGNFTSISGVERPRLARLFPDGTLDEQWLPQLADDGEFAVAGTSLVQPDGRVLVVVNYALRRLNADGSRDQGFNAPYWVDTVPTQGIQLQRDGRILLAGRGLSFGESERAVIRLHPDGSIDNSFRSPRFGNSVNGFNWVFGAEEMADGRILVFGNFASVDGRARRGLAVLHRNGRLDVTARFGGEHDLVWRARALSDGGIAAAYLSGAMEDGNELVVYRQKKTKGGLKRGPWVVDLSLSPNGVVNDIADDESGRVLIVGEFFAIDGKQVPTGIARLLR